MACRLVRSLPTVVPQIVSAIGPPVERRNAVSSASVSVFGTASTGPVVGGVNGFGAITARIAAMSLAPSEHRHSLPSLMASIPCSCSHSRPRGVLRRASA